MKIRRILAAILASALLLLGCTACGEEDFTAVSMYDLQKAMLAADDTLPEMSSVNSSSENAAELFTYLSDLDYEKVDSYFLAYAASGTAQEMAVIALKKTADVEEARKTIDSHLTARRNLYRNYAPEQVEAVENALLFTEGHYVVLIMSEKQDAVKTVCLQQLR